MSILQRLSQGAKGPTPSELEKQEQRIAAGLKSYTEVGDALQKIRDSRLYREQYPSWSAYLESRWNMTQPQSERLIAAAAVVAEIIAAGLVPPEREYHARQLTSVPQGQRAAAWAEVQETIGTDVTAEQIDKIADKYRRKSKRTKFNKPKVVKLAGKGWKLELSRKRADVDVEAALQEALALYQAKSRAA